MIGLELVIQLYRACRFCLRTGRMAVGFLPDCCGAALFSQFEDGGLYGSFTNMLLINTIFRSAARSGKT